VIRSAATRPRIIINELVGTDDRGDRLGDTWLTLGIEISRDEPPRTVIIGGRALLMLIAARFSGSGSGKDPSEPRDLADRLRPAAILAARVRARQEIA
jgi:hypothetical protein